MVISAVAAALPQSPFLTSAKLMIETLKPDSRCLFPIGYCCLATPLQLTRTKVAVGFEVWQGSAAQSKSTPTSCKPGA